MKTAKMYRDFFFSGVVFLQYREETKRAILPNEITTVDTVRVKCFFVAISQCFSFPHQPLFFNVYQVKALFVRAFPKLLSMQYLDCSEQRKIYILDQRKDMFYELEDLR